MLLKQADTYNVHENTSESLLFEYDTLQVTILSFNTLLRSLLEGLYGQGQLIGACFVSRCFHSVSHNDRAVCSVSTKCVIVVLRHTAGAR
jgi:hypothetical protein